MAYHPFHHLGLKFLSIVLAVVLWSAVGDQRVVERSMRVPLEFHNLPRNLELVASPPDVVEVRLRGASGALSRLAPGEVVAVLDLTAARAGTRLFHLITDEVRAPYGVEVAQVNPTTVSLTFEQSASKRVPVVPAVDGDPAEGYRVGRIKSDPEVVAIVGPASQVELVNSATTEPVSLARATTTVIDRVTVGVTRELVRLQKPETATVTVEILPISVQKRIEGVSVLVRNLGSGRTAAVVPERVDVLVRGPGPVLETLGSIEAFVDAAALRGGRYPLPVRVDPAPGVEVVDTEPSTVTVRIR